MRAGPEAEEQIEFVHRFHERHRDDDEVVAGGGAPDLSAGGYH